MKQIEIDSHIGDWFKRREELQQAEFNLRRAQSYFEASTERCARALMPQNATKDERWIFPTTDGRAVVAYLKEKISYSVPDSQEHRTYVPTCEEHKFK